LYKELNSPNTVISNVKDFHQLPQGRFSWLCTRHLRELVQHFSKDRLFMDVDTVEPGVDFVHAIEKAVDECGVLVALIGSDGWEVNPKFVGLREDKDPHDVVWETET